MCKRWHLKYAILFLLLYPLAAINAAQGQIAVQGQSISIKQAIELIEKNSRYPAHRFWLFGMRLLRRGTLRAGSD